MIWLSLAALALLLWFATTVWRIRRVSTGPQIPAEATGKAILVVDMQPAFLASGAYEDAEAELMLQNLLAHIDAAEAGTRIIALKQEWRGSGAVIARLLGGGAGLAGQPDTEVHPEIARRADVIVTKHWQDGFSGTALSEALEGIATLDITGLDGEHCVRATTLAALKRGYQITLAPSLVLFAQQKKRAAQLAALQNAGAKLAD
ncbi:isochorismatase family cysteine hydrolase [Pseudoruegeria sp. SHC-113]|uniref:isochorismatase family cysteine hydrolase n=1 Tax=Pseudoruegeria sp. SHC-113 TaxID=2855439 RepID=UPI0021BA5E12|nr:isochorismatase family cysteine hydrolase [Pseudoruegeria sp. SHC-113]MCT8161848.1 cysteine hydrolase [Pseudoruegeria sp. SHC-113]